ncbi:MAG: DNA polymerase I [Eubacteriales bacterium]|nr:DNA polymerase I [Eubacteriales bacterium]
MSEKILLIDGHSILNRAFYGLPDLTNSEGQHTGAVYGFLNILFRILEEEKPDYLTVAFDLKEPTFRHKMYPEYKGTRHAMPEELREQVPLIKEMLGAMGVVTVSMAGFEADDILGTLARRSEEKQMEATILSGDRDLLQLATDKVMIRLPKTVRGQTNIENYHTKEVLEKYQVTPPQIIDLKALMGDSSDNIPGIPGVGEKTATKLIVAYGSIENAHDHVEEIKPNKARESLRDHYDLAQLSKILATINTEVPLEYDYEKARFGNLYTREAYELCKRLEFKNLLGRFDQTQVSETVDEQEFFVCSDLEGVENLFGKAAEQDRVGVSLALEDNTCYGLGLCLGEKETYVIPVQGLLRSEYLLQKLSDLSESSVLCSMDVKQMLKHVSVSSEDHVFDVSVAAYLHNPLKSQYTYDDTAREFLNGILLPSREDLLGKKSIKKAWEEDDDNLVKLLGYEANAVYRLQEPLMDMLEKTGMRQVYEEIERPLIFTLDSMEKYGVLVRGEELSAYGDRLSGRIEELKTSIYTQAGEEFNINSPKQLGVILFEKMGIPGSKKTKTGYSTSAEILEKLSGEQPIIKDILEYRQLTKLKSTYADGLAAVIGEDGRIHSTFNQTITATGRISSAEPNLQNIPVRMELGRLIRKVFVPKDGFVFLDADYSQIELRVLAHMSGDERLIQAYREAQDIHRMTASQVFHVPFEEVTPLQRRNAKAVNFGIVYGISAFGLSEDLSITRKEASEYIEQYFRTYPKIKEFLDRCVETAKTEGYGVTMFGRRRPIPELKSANFMQRSFGERVAMNSPIQGTAADIIKIAMNRVRERLSEEHLESRLVLQVHDELLIETKREELPRVSVILEEEMRNAADLSVNLEVDMHSGDNWYEAK